MVKEVRTVTIDGKVHALPEGIEIQVQFTNGDGKLFDSAEEAVKNQAINDAQHLITDCVDWRNEEFDTQLMIANRANIIDALRRIDGG